MVRLSNIFDVGRESGTPIEQELSVSQSDARQARERWYQTSAPGLLFLSGSGFAVQACPNVRFTRFSWKTPGAFCRSSRRGSKESR
jgi:hypothetical protein